MQKQSVRVAVGQFNELTDERLKFAAQIGASGIQLNTPLLPGDVRWEEADLRRLVERTRAQPRSAQRRIVAPNERFEPGVARLGQQHGADAGGNVAGPCAALAGVGKPAGEASSGVHLQQQFGQVHPWQAGCDGA